MSCAALGRRSPFSSLAETPFRTTSPCLAPVYSSFTAPCRASGHIHRMGVNATFRNQRTPRIVRNDSRQRSTGRSCRRLGEHASCETLKMRLCQIARGGRPMHCRKGLSPVPLLKSEGRRPNSFGTTRRTGHAGDHLTVAPGNGGRIPYTGAGTMLSTACPSFVISISCLAYSVAGAFSPASNSKCLT